ncbi:MAG TPA: cation-transporting P-type ATPase, partial [Actinomycetota bacterium]|nr:cation-transporting P-type ATPase [Actinomycetota bacterium]
MATVPEELEARHEPGGNGRLEPVAFAQLPVDEVYVALASAPTGLSNAEADARRSLAGLNQIVELPGSSWWHRLLEQFVHLFALLLWAGALLALVAGEATIAVAIVAVIILNGVFGFVQEHAAERAVAALKRLLPGEAAVFRDGAAVRLPLEQLVPGDVIVLQEG